MKKKYLITIALPFLILIIFSNYLFYIYLKTDAKKDFETKSSQLTSQISNYYNFWLNDQKSIANEISKNHKILKAVKNPNDIDAITEAEIYLNNLHNSFQYNESLPIVIFNDSPIKKNINNKEVEIKNGEIFIDTVNNELLGKGGLKHPYINEIYNGKEYYISEIYPSLLSKKPIFSISSAIKDKGKIIGAAIMTPQMDYFNKLFINSVSDKLKGHMILVDEDGKIISHPNKNFVLSNEKEKIKFGKDLAKSIKEKNKNAYQKKYLSKEKFYYGEKIKSSSEHFEKDIYIVFTKSTSEVFQNVKKIFYPTFIASLAISLLILTFLINFVYINKNNFKKSELLKLNKELEKQVDSRTRKLKNLAIRDSLTNLYNHKYSYKILQHLISKSKKNDFKLTCIMADIDDLKKINYEHGHNIGDEILIQLSQIFKDNLRESDIIGRYGGEEFIIILPFCSLNTAKDIAKKLQTIIRTKKFTDKSISLTISMGITEYNRDYNNDLINQVDRLLCKAKANGKNQFAY